MPFGGQSKIRKGKSMRSVSETEDFIMSSVLGKRIIRIRPMTPDESKAECWPHRPDITVLELENGTKLYAPPLGVGREAKVYGEHKGKLFRI